MIIGVEGAGVVHVDLAKQLYNASVRSEAEFFSVPPHRAHVDQVSHSVEQPGRPLDELMWKAAYFGSSGRLLKGCNLYDVVELRRWPNFTRLPHATSCLPLCSLLARRPSSIAFAHRMLRIPPAEAMSFCSAARSAGYLRMVSSQPESGDPEHSAESEQTGESEGSSSSFWGRLFSCFSGL